jgi:hypothetical protein
MLLREGVGKLGRCRGVNKVAVDVFAGVGQYNCK